MIDGFKLRVTEREVIDKLLVHPALDFKAEVSTVSGEEGFIKRAVYKGLRFEFVNSRCKPELYIRGCLPAYSNGLNNYINLSLKESRQAMVALCQELDLPTTTEVIKLEYGLNFPLPANISVNRFISNILVYKGKIPAERNFGNGMMIKFDLAEFAIKIYNKGAQHRTHSNIIRYELAVQNRSFLKRVGIHTVIDLQIPLVAKKLQSKLLDVTGHLVYYDNEIIPDSLNKRQMAEFLRFYKPQAWERLIAENPELYKKKKKAFATKVTKASGINWNKLFYERVEEEASKLFASN